MKKIANIGFSFLSFLIGVFYFIFCIPFAVIDLIGKLFVKIGNIRDLMKPWVEKTLLRIKKKKDLSFS